MDDKVDPATARLFGLAMSIGEHYQNTYPTRKEALRALGLVPTEEVIVGIIKEKAPDIFRLLIRDEISLNAAKNRLVKRYRNNSWAAHLERGTL